MVAGILSGIVVSLFLTKLMKTAKPLVVLKRFHILSYVLSAVTHSAFTFAAWQSGSEALLIILAALVGVSNVPIFFMAFELAYYQLPDVGEAMSCGTVNFLANLLGFIALLGLTPLLESKDDTSID
jgi:hypothetical protein